MNDNLSRAASLVVSELKQSSDACVEAAYWGAGECGKDIWQGTKRRMLEGLASLGFTPQNFVDECKARTSPRFVYDMGFLVVLDD